MLLLISIHSFPNIIYNAFISLAATALFIAMYVLLFLISDISKMWKILGAVLTVFAVLSSCFSLKHLIFHNVDFGVVRCMRPYNLLVLICTLSVFA